MSRAFCFFCPLCSYFLCSEYLGGCGTCKVICGPPDVWDIQRTERAVLMQCDFEADLHSAHKVASNRSELTQPII